MRGKKVIFLFAEISRGLEKWGRRRGEMVEWDWQLCN